MKKLKLSFLTVLLFTVFSSAAYSQAASVISENANLRGTPTNKGKVIYTLPKGSEIEVIQQKGMWFLVQSSDYVGWIHGNTIRLEDQSLAENTYEDGVILVPIPKGTETSSSTQEEKVKRPPRIGMTTWEARESTWGPPDEINRTTSTLGIQEQWVYGSWRYGKIKFLYFNNGRLSSISE